jgi:hypothetical protein
VQSGQYTVDSSQKPHAGQQSPPQSVHPQASARPARGVPHRQVASMKSAIVSSFPVQHGAPLEDLCKAVASRWPW